MNATYRPRAGSAAALVIAHLEEHGGTLTAVEAAAVTGKEASSTSSLLRAAVQAGLLVAEGDRATGCTYSLPEPAQPSDGKLQITTWEDGDVVVTGGTTNEDGSKTYTRAQMQQLLQRLTTPHLQLPDVAKEG